MGTLDSIFLVILQIGDLIEPVLDGAKESGGGWAVYVLLVFMGGIFYFVGLWLALKSKADERRDIARKAEYDQRLTERKAEFEAILERERQNTASYQATTDRMTAAFERYAGALAELTGVIKPLAETMQRIDKHIEQQSYQSRGMGGK